jgi:hypothetical protein
MRTRLTIMGIVLAAVAAALGTIALLGALFGWPGLAIGVLGAAAVLVAYRLLLQPWQHRWGATDQEVHRAMPGDDLILDAASTTRATPSRSHPSTSGPGWSSSATAGVAGTAMTGSTTTASPAPTASSPNSSSCRSATRS